MPTTIKIKNGSGAPLAADLVQGEPAFDLTNKRLYTEDSLGAVIEIGTNPSSLTTSSADINGGTIDGVTIGGASAGAGTFTTVTASGEIAANGGIALGDNDKATFGASDDLEIYHDGSYSYIKDAGTGDLRIQGSTNVQIWNSSLDKQAANFNAAGGQTLYYDNAAKLATTNTGIDVTGTVTADGLTVDGTSVNLTDTTSAGNSVNINGYGNAGATLSSQLLFKNYNGVPSNFSMASIEAVTGSNRNNGGLVFSTYEGSLLDRLKIDYNGDISFYEDTGTTPKLFWDASAESLGIGTTSPASLLEVRGSTSIISRFRDSTNGIVDIKTTGSTNADPVQIDALNRSLTLAVNSTAHLCIDTSGRVGIGTSSPVEKLTVSGSISTSSDLVLKESTTARGYIFGTSAGVTYRATSGLPHIWQSVSTERMRLDSSGNLGLGVTPSAWGTWKAFDLVSGGLALTSSGTADARVTANSYYDGTNFKYKNTGAATSYRQTSGAHQFLTAPSGTAGNAITFTQAMTLDASGNLLVGKTSDSNALTGCVLRNSGTGTFVADGFNPLILNRLTSDGDIVHFRKDGTTVGSIGSIGGTQIAMFGSGGKGVQLGGAGHLSPANTSGNLDATLNLGSDVARFKDLYLSGGVYLGGTGAANHLDDYEEGTWTPVFAGTTTAGTYTYTYQIGRYTKVGNLVTVTCSLVDITESVAGTGNVSITGLPFTSSNITGLNYPAAVNLSRFNLDGEGQIVNVQPNSSAVEVILMASGSGAGALLAIGDRTGNSSDILFTLTYQTG